MSQIEFYDDLKAHLGNVQNPGKSTPQNFEFDLNWACNRWESTQDSWARSNQDARSWHGKSQHILKVRIRTIFLIKYACLQKFSMLTFCFFFCFQKKFLASLVKELSDETNNESVRQMACIILKNLISNRSVVSQASFNVFMIVVSVHHLRQLLGCQIYQFYLISNLLVCRSPDNSIDLTVYKFCYRALNMSICGFNLSQFLSKILKKQCWWLLLPHLLWLDPRLQVWWRQLHQLKSQEENGPTSSKVSARILKMKSWRSG